MAIQKIYAHVNCANLTNSEMWYTNLFGRTADSRPMTGLVEWHFRESAGLQLFENLSYAGQGTLTLIVSDLEFEHARVTNAGLNPGTIEQANYTRIVRLRDIDNNLVVLAEPTT